MKRIFFMVLAIAAITFMVSCGNSAPSATQTPALQPATQPTVVSTTAANTTEVSFSKDVMPIFSNSCTKCHGVDQVKAGLDMTTYDKLMAGSFKGPALVAGNASESKLIQMVLNGKMPKRGDKLTPEQIQIITNWINSGARNN